MGKYENSIKLTGIVKEDAIIKESKNKNFKFVEFYLNVERYNGKVDTFRCVSFRNYDIDMLKRDYWLSLEGQIETYKNKSEFISCDVICNKISRVL